MRVQLYENKGSKENPKISDYPTILEVYSVSLTELGEIKERDRLLLHCTDKDEDQYVSERKISRTEYQEIMEKLISTGYADLTSLGTFTDDECPETDKELAEEDRVLDAEESRVESSAISSDNVATDRKTKAWIIGVILVLCFVLGAGIAEFAWLKLAQNKSASTSTSGYVIPAGHDEEIFKDTLYLISDSSEEAKGRTFTDTVCLGAGFKEGKEYTLKTELRRLTEEEYKAILMTYGSEYLRSGTCGELLVSKETKFTYDPNNSSFEVSLTVPES